MSARSRAAVLLAVLSGAASAGRADTYPRQPGVDVLHYAFRLTLTDASDAIEGEATVTVRLAAGVREIALDLAQPKPAASGRGMTVRGVTEAGAALSFEHTGDRLRIALGRPAEGGARPTPG